MTKRGLSLTLDAAMFAGTASLFSWNLTGVRLHEQIGAVLAVCLLVHLLLHYSWIESRAARLRVPGARRNRINVALNGTLFVAMVAALASGVFMSKSLFPAFHPVREYLKWHEIHETASNLILVLVGLHVALNWSLIAAGLRRALSRPAPLAPSREEEVPPAAKAGSRAAVVGFRRLGQLAAAAALVTAGAWALQHALPATATVTVVSRDGHRSQIAPPQEIATLRPDQKEPSVKRGGGRFVVRLALLCAVAIAGRRVLKLRLE